MKTVTDMFEPYIGVKEYNGIVATMLKWYYGELKKVAWCAVSMSYMMNKMGLLDQLGGKNQNVYRMMIATENACKKTGKGKFYYKKNIPNKYLIKRGTIMFMLNSASPMTANSSKHVTSVYKDFVYRGTGTYQSLGGNQSDEIKVKSYYQSRIYAIFVPDYVEDDDDHTTLKKGSKGDEVIELQNVLNKLGYPDNDYNALKPDGNFGEKTEQAVKTLQKHNDLKVDGVCGPKTWAKIEKLLKEPKKEVEALRTLIVHAAPSSSSKTKTKLKKGEKVQWSYMQNKWLFVPRYSGWITSLPSYVQKV